MNYFYLVLEVFIVFLLLAVFYKIDKKDGLYVYIALMSAVIGFILIGTIQILSFQINLGIPIIMGIFIANNIIIQRYGLDEVKRILYTSGASYVISIVVISLVTLIVKSEFDISSNAIYNLLFGYSLNNLRCVVACFISMAIMIWIGSGIYYSIRKSKNVLFVSNLVVTFVICFIESLIFVLVAYSGEFEAIEIFGMISIRYLVEVIMGIIGIIPLYVLVKYIDK